MSVSDSFCHSRMGGAPAAPTRVFQRRPPASPSLPQRSPSGPRTQPPSPPGAAPRAGTRASPRSRIPLTASLPRRKPGPSLPCRVPWSSSGPQWGGTRLRPQTSQRRALTELLRGPGPAPARWRGRVAVWPCGPGAGPGRQARPLLPRVPRGPLGSASAGDSAPARPALPRQRAPQSRDLIPPAEGHVTPRAQRGGTPWCVGSRRVPVQKPSKGAHLPVPGGAGGGCKPGHPSLPHPRGRAGSCAVSPWVCPAGAGQARPAGPEVCASERRRERGAPGVSPEGSPG